MESHYVDLSGENLTRVLESIATEMKRWHEMDPASQGMWCNRNTGIVGIVELVLDPAHEQRFMYFLCLGTQAKLVLGITIEHDVRFFECKRSLGNRDAQIEFPPVRECCLVGAGHFPCIVTLDGG